MAFPGVIVLLYIGIAGKPENASRMITVRDVV
jgi:hypothetical protein